MAGRRGARIVPARNRPLRLARATFFTQPSLFLSADYRRMGVWFRQTKLRLVTLTCRWYSILSLSLGLQPHAHLRLFSSRSHCRTPTSLIVHLYAELAPFLGAHPLSHSGSETIGHMALFSMAWRKGASIKYVRRFFGFFAPPPLLVRKFMQPRLLSFSTTSAFGPITPPPQRVRT